MSHQPVPPDAIEHHAASFVEQNEWDLFETNDLREQIRKLEPLQTDRLDTYVQNVFSDEPPAGVRRRLRPTSEWLAYDASDEQIADFLKRHNAILDNLNRSPAIAERFFFLKDSYINRLHDGMAQGWVSQSATAKIRRIRAMGLYVGDFRDTILVWKVGQYRNAFNHMTIAQGIGPDEQTREREVMDSIYESLPHEASHVFGRWLPHWAGEAFAEHMNLVVRNGDYCTVSPSDRPGDSSPYYAAERSLLHYVLNLSPAGEPAGREATASFLRGATSEDEASAEWQAFNRAIDAMWGASGVMVLVSAAVDCQEGILKRERPRWNEWQIEREAATRVKNMLDQSPRSVLGGEYSKSPHHAGAAILASALR
ncbi:MAG TPA: hypothetical protein VFT16_05115 [Candidatus Saccharimonadales bacterium]|nr:hypothetical protein [Candidatus Saccharimonadales bacterium]